MKKYISAALALTVGILPSLAAPKTITIKSLDDLANNKTYLIVRNGSTRETSGYVYATDKKDGAQLVSSLATQTDTASIYCKYSIHYSEREQAYYLYNLGAENFVSANKQNLAVTSSSAGEFKLVYNDPASSWVLISDGYALGMMLSNGSFLFLDDYHTSSLAKKSNMHFEIKEVNGITISQAEVDAIEEKVASGRAAKLKEYNSFVKDASNVVNTSDLPRYIGDYDLDELKYALENDSKYSMREIEEIYQRTLMSRYPKDGHYYRLHNGNRPGGSSARKSNVLATTHDGRLLMRELEYHSYGTATDDYTDDLNLFCVNHYYGDPTRITLRAAAFDKYLMGGANQQRLNMVDAADDATAYDLNFLNTRAKRLTIANTAVGTYLSVTAEPDFALWGYNVLESSSEWYFEPINTITIPVDANGYGTFCLPCGVTLPEGVQAFTVSEIAQGKAYVQEIKPQVYRYVPCIIKAAPGTKTVDLTVVDNENQVATAMTGHVRKASTGTPGRYVPTFSDKGITLTYAAASEDVPMPGTIYVAGDDLGALETIVNDLPEDHLENISSEEADAANLYDLHGRSVSGNLRPGIYINATTHKAIRIQ
ncbi:MAG: hypothetical protein NC301_04595 [Bacteroides sp.]|nr:hypothetical protein [Bacteroides sp.]MCM1378484.1 hypothetical protein [Bacteroides sp.]MCM1444785.1 hypothetical protein [Prevotella sp.]